MMNLLRQRYRAWIVPYVEGTLDARRQAKLEAWLAHDPVLAAEAEAERRVSARLRAAAQATDGTGNPNSLWPSIQAHLEPRRASIRPLLLVGGLSAATATLIGAALWGPLKPTLPLPVPKQVVAKNDPNVIIVVPPSVRKGRHFVRSWHKGNGGGKRPAVYHILPIPNPGIRRDETQPQDLLAVNPVGTPEGSGQSGASSAPKFAPSSHNFRLTGNEHSPKSDPAPGTTPSDSGAAMGNTDTHSDGSDTADPSSRPAEGATPDTPPAVVAAPSDGAATKPAAVPHRRQGHRRHGHTTHTPTPSTSDHEGTVSTSTDSTNTGHDAPPTQPKAKIKPVD